MKSQEIKNIQEKEKGSFRRKINYFFEFIDFINATPDDKQRIALKVKNTLLDESIYRVQMSLSGIIAALGLLQDSVAVVIGAMLIAPLLGTMNGLSFSVARGEKHLFYKSLKMLIISIFIGVFSGYILAFLVGFHIENSEIISRTSPNILDLFIAFFSAVIAIMSLKYEKLSDSVAGVAIAAALVPPLAVIGIELFLGNYNLAYGATVLFFTNILSIILVGIIFFWIYGFTPNDNGDKQKNSLKSFIVILSIMILISLPLINSLTIIKEKANITKQTQDYFENILEIENKNISISNIEIKDFSEDFIQIDLLIKLPEGVNFYDNFNDKLDSGLSKKLGRKVKLNIELIRIANIS